MIKAIIFCVLFSQGFQTIYAQCTNPSATTVSGSHAPGGQICSGDLLFEDTFDGFDFDKWQHEQTMSGGGNGEFQWYTNTRENSFVDNGVLHLKPTLVVDPSDDGWLYWGSIDISDKDCTDSGNNGCHRVGTETHILNPIKSAKVRTRNSFNFKYGSVEVRAKVPAGDWLWPAIWFMPKNSVYGGWPASGEIDLMESRGNRDYTNGNGQQIGTQRVGSTMHWGPAWNHNQYTLTHWEQHNGNGYNADFHSYQLHWTPDGISFSVDGNETGSIYPPNGGFWELGNLGNSGYDNPWGNSKMAPFDQEFYLMFNLAIGGTGYFPDNAHNGAGNKPWKNGANAPMTDFWKGHDQWLPTWKLETNEAALQIDYVRIWAL